MIGAVMALLIYFTIVQNILKPYGVCSVLFDLLKRQTSIPSHAYQCEGATVGALAPYPCLSGSYTQSVATESFGFFSPLSDHLEFDPFPIELYLTWGRVLKMLVFTSTFFYCNRVIVLCFDAILGIAHCLFLLLYARVKTFLGYPYVQSQDFFGLYKFFYNKPNPVMQVGEFYVMFLVAYISAPNAFVRVLAIADFYTKLTLAGYPIAHKDYYADVLRKSTVFKELESFEPHSQSADLELGDYFSRCCQDDDFLAQESARYLPTLQSGDWVSSLLELLRKGKKMWTSPVVRTGGQLIILVISLLCYGKTSDFSMDNFDKLRKNFGFEKVNNGFEFLSTLCSSITYLLTKGKALFAGGVSFDDFFDIEDLDDFGERLNLLEEAARRIASLRPTDDINLNNIQARYTSLYTAYLKVNNLLISRGSNKDKTMGMVIRSRLRTIDNLIRDHIDGQSIRMAPYAVLLHGGTALGKSTMVNYLSRAGFAAFGEDYNSSLVYYRNSLGKFWDGYNRSTLVTVVDELACKKTNVGAQTSMDEFLQLVNNTQYVLDMADLPDKGMTFQSKVVIGTTNKADLDLRKTFHLPVAAMRRFKRVVNVEVKPQFAKDPSLPPLARVLDPQKVEDARVNLAPGTEAFDSPWICHVCEVLVKPDGGEDQLTYELKKIHSFDCADDFIAYFGREIRAHKEQQERLMDTLGDDKLVMCKECFYTHGKCKCSGGGGPLVGSGTVPMDGVPLGIPVTTDGTHIGTSVVPFPGLQPMGIVNQSEDSYDYLGIRGFFHAYGISLLVGCIPLLALGLIHVSTKIYAYISYYYNLAVSYYWVVYKIDVVVRRYYPRVRYYYDVYVLGVDRVSARIRAWRGLLPCARLTVFACVLMSSLLIIKKTITGIQMTLNSYDILSTEDRFDPNDAAKMAMGDMKPSQWQRDLTHKDQISNYSATAGDFVLKHVRSNIAFLSTQGGTASTTRRFHALGLGDTIYVVNNHSLSGLDFPDGYRKFNFLCHGSSTDTEVNVHTSWVHRLPDLDIALIDLKGTPPRVTLGYDSVTRSFNAEKSPFVSTLFLQKSQGVVGSLHLYPRTDASQGADSSKGLSSTTPARGSYSGLQSISSGVTPPIWISDMQETTHNGDCGAPFVATVYNGSGAPRHIVIGIHVAVVSRTKHQWTTCLTTDILSRLISEYVARNQNSVSRSDIELHSFTTLNGDMKLGLERHDMTIGLPHPKSTPFFVQHERNFHFIGSLAHSDGERAFRPNHKSLVTRTPFADDSVNTFGDCGKVRPDTCGWLPRFMALVGLIPNLSPFYYHVVTIAAHAYVRDCSRFLKDKVREVGKVLRPMTLDDNINGVPGVPYLNRINMNTGGGFGYPGKKWKHCTYELDEHYGVKYAAKNDVVAEAQYIISRYEEGYRAYPVFNANFKDEPISQKKFREGRTRVIAACNFPFIIVTRMFFLPMVFLMEKYRLHFEMAVGINVDGPEWTTFVNHLLGVDRGEADVRRSRVVAGDFKGWDRTVLNSLFMTHAFQALISMMRIVGNYSPIDLNCMWGVATDICYATWNFFGDYLVFCGTNPSGQGLTVIINSIVNSILMRYFFMVLWCEHRHMTVTEASFSDLWDAMDEFSKDVIFISYGDDNILTCTNEYFTFANISRVAADHNIEYTDPNKKGYSYDFMTIEEATFLKRGFVKPLYSMYWYAPLERDVIAKMTQVYVPKSMSKQDHMVELLTNADRFAYKHGREYHTKVREFVVRQMTAMGVLCDLPTFEKYHLDEFDEHING